MVFPSKTEIVCIKYPEGKYQQAVDSFRMVYRFHYPLFILDKKSVTEGLKEDRATYTYQYILVRRRNILTVLGSLLAMAVIRLYLKIKK